MSLMRHIRSDQRQVVARLQNAKHLCIYIYVPPRRHLTKRPPEIQVASWLKSAEEEATLLTIDLSAHFCL